MTDSKTKKPFEKSDQPCRDFERGGGGGIEDGEAVVEVQIEEEEEEEEEETSIATEEACATSRNMGTSWSKIGCSLLCCRQDDAFVPMLFCFTKVAILGYR